MGWFDSEIIFVDVLTTKLTDSEVTPIKNSIMSAVMRDSGVSDGILAGMINGLAPRAHRYFKYAEDGKYINGLPTAEIGIEHNAGDSEAEYSPFPGSFLPIANIRQNGAFLNPDTEPEKHASTKKLMKRVALNLDNIISNISQDRLDEAGNPIEGNPVDQLDDVFFLFGIDLYTKHAQACTYMFDFWEHIKNDVVVSKEEFLANIEAFEDESSNAALHFPSNSIRFTEEFSETTPQYRVLIKFDWMEYREEQGILKEPFSGDNKEEDYIIVAPGTTEKFERYIGETGETIVYIDTSIMICHKQLRRIKDGDHEDVYGVWEIAGLNHETAVAAYGDTNQVYRTINGYTPDSGETGTWDDYYFLDKTDENFGRSAFYFPICKEVLDLQSTMQEEEVLIDGMILVMHAAEEVELEWYQQGWFKIVMVIVVAAIIYFSAGTLFKEGMTFLEFAMALGTQFGLSYIVELLIKHVDGDLALILAAAVSIYAVSKGDFSNVKNLFPHAKELLQATKVVTQVSKAKIKNDQLLLNEEIEEFSLALEEREDQLAEAYALLTTSKFDPLWLDVESRVQAEGSPSDFYKRAKTTNVASLVKESISTYHSRMKRLPTGIEDNSYATA